MRNPGTTSVDYRSVPLRQRGGHIWINLWGRHLILKKWKPSLMEVAGYVIGCAGVAGLIWGSLEDFDPTRIGIVLLVLGAVLLSTKCLKTNNLASNEIYNLGRERGEGDTWDEAYQAGFADGERSRPVVVPFPPQCTCGNPACAQPVGVAVSNGARP